MSLRLPVQLFVFLLVGAAQVLVDSSVFIVATALGALVVPANVLGRVCGAGLGFWLNGRYTFAAHGQQRLGGRQFGRFLIAWLALTLLSSACMHAISQWASLHWVWLAKPAVEALMASIGFFVWRHWVYR